MEHPPSTERRSMVSCFCASCSWLEWQKAHLQGKKSASLPCRTQPSERAQKSALGLRVLPLSRTEPQLDVFHGALKRSPQWPMCPTVSIYEADVKAHTGTKSHCLTEVSIQGEKSQWPPGVAFQGVHVYGLKKKKWWKTTAPHFIHNGLGAGTTSPRDVHSVLSSLVWLGFWIEDYPGPTPWNAPS